MGINQIASMVKPNSTSLGFALFLAVNAASIWGGYFPFLPLDVQEPQHMFWFFTAQSIVFSLVYLLSAVGSYFFPGQTRYFLVKLAAAPYFLGWCFLIGAMYVQDYVLPLLVLGGAALGLGSAGFFMMWQRIFASQEADEGTHNLILGTAYASLIYFALYLIPTAVTAYLIPLVFLPLFGLAVILKSRTIDVNQAMFLDAPRYHPQVYRTLVQDFWRSAFAIAAFAFCAGVMRSLAIEHPEMGNLINVSSMATAFVAAVILLVIWLKQNVRLSILGMYRCLFPVLITLFLLLPFLGDHYKQGLASGLYAVYSVAIILMMMQCAQASRDRGVNPIFVYGFFGFVVYGLHGVGFISGSLSEKVSILQMQPLAVVALVAVYLLALIYFIGQGSFRGKLYNANDLHHNADKIEIVALKNADFSRKPDKAVSQITFETILMEEEEANAPDQAPPEEMRPLYQDRISKQIALLQRFYRLSSREAEVAELIARGNTVARISEMLVVSENTIRTHTKRIYAKLDIHKKQELCDLVDSFNPSDLA